MKVRGRSLLGQKKGIEKVCGRYYALMDAIFSIIFDPAVIRSQKSIVHTIRRLPVYKYNLK